MFTFDDLIYADGRGLQDLLSKVDRKVLCYARTASPEVEEKIFSQMSRRAAELLKDDMDVMGRVRGEVEEAQRTVGHRQKNDQGRYSHRSQAR